MRALGLSLALAACSFNHGSLSTGGGGDGGGGDGDIGDGTHGPGDARPIDAVVDAMPCPSSPPPGCGTGVFFYCPGSNSCFVFCPSTKSFTNAETACTGWTAGAHLASPTGGELTCVSQKMTATTINGDSVTIGLRQTGSQSTPTAGWSWLDGTPYTTAGWCTSPQQPDDYDGSENGSEDCGNLERGFNWLWNDGSCTDPQPFLCERP